MRTLSANPPLRRNVRALRRNGFASPRPAGLRITRLKMPPLPARENHMNFAIRLLAAAARGPAGRRLCGRSARPDDRRDDVAAEARRHAGDLARRQVRGLRRSRVTTTENDKGDADLYLVPTAGGKPQRLTSIERQRVRADLEPGRPLHRLRREARRRQAVAALRDRRERRRSDARQRHPDRRRRAEVVPGLEAHRLHHRGLAGHHGLGQDQGQAERARRVEDERDDLGPPAGHALGSLHRGSHPAPLFRSRSTARRRSRSR